MAGKSTSANGNIFDYIIIGAGSAGCVLANRLSEDPSVTVCLIEAGPADRHPLIHIPLGVIGLIHHRTLNWRFFSSPQQHLGNRKLYVPRGRVLGGTSSINAMVYIRGHRLDYDDWARLGNPGWAYRDVLPYFRKSEHNEGLSDSQYHGGDGLLNVTYPARPNPLNEVFLAATAQLQLRRRERGFNEREQEGFGYHQVTQRNGRRESTATAFLDPARRRHNLAVVTGGLVNSVILADKRATGVELERGGAIERYAARREVILSAGAIGSPTILMRSGIGDGEALGRLGIASVHHAPGIGRNLQDHMGLGIQIESKDSRCYGLSFRTMPRNAWACVDYLLFRRGMLATNVVETGGFYRTDAALDRPNIQYSFMAARMTSSGRLVGAGIGFGVATILLRPASRGSVTLATPDTRAAPIIDFNAFAAGVDIQTFLTAYRNARSILAAPAFAPYRVREASPGDHVQTDAEFDAHIRANVGTIFHPVGTCRMGIDSDAVVDPELRVHGLHGLRVVDASIMPIIIGGNTNAPTIMIAEKAADMIRGRVPLPPVTDA